MGRICAIALACSIMPWAAAADPFPTRQGSTGILDVPDAEALGRGGGMTALELRLDHRSGGGTDVGPLPLSLAYGLGAGLDVGLYLREWGRAGDPVPSPLIAGAALKLQVLRPEGLVPGLALEAIADALTWKASGELRLVASTGQVGRLRVAAYAGSALSGPGFSSAALAGGLGATVAMGSGLDAALEGLHGPGGPTAGAALRWAITPTVGSYAALTWLPDDRGVRFSLGFALRSPAREAPRRAPPPPVAAPAPPEVPPPAAPTFLDDRPRFRMRIPAAEVPGERTERRHRQLGPTPPRQRAAAPPAPKPITAEEARLQRLAAAEAALAGREKRLRAAEADLGAREQRAAAERVRLDAAARELSRRERLLEGHERRLERKGAPAAAERDARAAEERLRREEQALASQERQHDSRARRHGARAADARDREEALRAPVQRLQAALAREKVRSRKGDLMTRLGAAREQQLVAMEARLTETRDRLEAQERATAVLGQRLIRWRARLDSLEARLALARAAVPKPPQPPRRRAARGGKPALVMVVKPPSSVSKSPAGGEPARAAPAAAAPGVIAMEKAVAAATMLAFATPADTIRQLDREAVERIARLAEREGCQLLIWGRAADPSLLGEAGRRAEEVKALVLGIAPGLEKQTVTRLTTRPTTQGVDLVVSALRDQPVAGAKAAEPAPAAPPLQEGETGRRQIREAVVAHGGDIERCAEAALERRGLESSQATLRIGVDARGRVARLSLAEGPLADPEMERCLQQAAGAWQLPAADTEYAVEIPISLVGSTGATP